MSKTLASAIVGAILLGPVCADAQTDAVPFDLRRWEASGNFDGLWAPDHEWDELDGIWESWITAFGGSIGYYWNSHVKSEVSVMLTPPLASSDLVRFPPTVVPPRGALYFIDNTLKVATISPRATYQFRENVFAHPYVSAGIRLLVLREHRVGDGAAYEIGGNGIVAVPIVNERSGSLRARPFVAGGFKSYFNERVFVGTEIQAVLGSTSGATSLTGRISVGADF